MFPNVQLITWNYSEAGHGKGAPLYGVGGTLKKTADRVVSYNQDVDDFNSFINVMSQEVCGIKVLPITTKDIGLFLEDEKKRIIPFIETMKVH